MQGMWLTTRVGGDKCGKAETHKRHVKSARVARTYAYFRKSLIRSRAGCGTASVRLPSTFPGQALTARSPRPEVTAGPSFLEAFLSIRDPCVRGADGIACPDFRHLINLISCR